ncbi:hypothetical protein RE628_10505 [Paenibacillus sp. D2_2]|uniref:hypothetical protein n=1 Tax=Paenibacillus sp. D2_2 TaxID=3073092 RepID=UPI002814ED6F|nr:hypothetical protein [Paenibacillus sp. D2_2]WMT42689.1 hypothetical protein RE628_10505 [Paenibacillus sp. D2_2]
MDKRKVINAYRRGFLTPQECAQVLGIERKQLDDLLANGAEDLYGHSSATAGHRKSATK